MLAAIAVGVLVLLAVGYLSYGRLIAAQFRLDPQASTPAVEVNDGEDFVPTRPFYLMGQHFAAIAAAGPIVGPIAACLAFGWLPCLLWIGLGVIFIGAVHDFTALVASVRHKARSIAEIVKQHLSRRAWAAMLGFIWIALVYVIIAFADVTAATFLGRIEELEGVQVGFERGGAVAFASCAYLLLALVMGVVQKKLNPKLWIVTLIFVPAAFGVIWLGTKSSTLLVVGGANPQKVWALIIMGYCFVAALLPVWLLVQPRGYLGGFVLYVVLGVSVLGLFVGSLRGELAVSQAAFKGFNVGGETGLLFPFLFVTIACGACSGFHGLVCGGTTSKQILREPHCRPVGYGAMLMEGFVAVIALATVMIAAPLANGKYAPAGAIYGGGIATFVTSITGRGDGNWLLLLATVFGSMAFSTFVFDTLDVATRLGRYIVEELFQWRGKTGAVVGTGLTAGVPAIFLLASPPKAEAWRTFWTLFGTSNQLLAALTLLGLTVWLKRSGRRSWFTFWPMVFVMGVTLTALVLQSWSGFAAGTGVGVMNGVVALVLISLTALIVVEAVLALRRPVPPLAEATAML